MLADCAGLMAPRRRCRGRLLQTKGTFSFHKFQARCLNNASILPQMSRSLGHFICHRPNCQRPDVNFIDMCCMCSAIPGGNDATYQYEDYANHSLWNRMRLFGKMVWRAISPPNNQQSPPPHLPLGGSLNLCPRRDSNPQPKR